MRASAAAAFLLLSACRAGDGERCVCAADCKAGLTCILENGAVLDEGTCAPDGAAGGGLCLPEGSNPGTSGSGGGPPLYMDLGSKRDFEPPGPTTSTGTTPTDTGTDTGTTSTSTGGTSTATASATGP